MTITGDMIFEAYESRLRRRQASPCTMQGFRIAAAHFERSLDPATATALDIEEWLSGQGWAVSTQHTVFTWVRASYRYAVKRGLLDRDPTVMVELPRLPDPDPRCLTVAEIEDAVSGCRSELDLLILDLFRYTGMRIVEMHRLTVNDIEGGQMHIHGKGGRWRWLPIHPEIRLTTTHPWVLPGRNGPMTTAAIRKRLGRFTDANPHSFRSTVATYLGRADVPETVIQAILGHRPNTIYGRHYRVVSPDEMLRALLQLPY